MNKVKLCLETMALLACLYLTGCASSEDPFAAERDALASGSEAMIYRDTTYGVPGNEDPSKVHIDLPDSDLGFDNIAVGTKVRIVEDPEATTKDSKRHVKVNILDGDLNGKVGLIAREYLRAIRDAR